MREARGDGEIGVVGELVVDRDRQHVDLVASVNAVPNAPMLVAKQIAPAEMSAGVSAGQG